jgi:hypothetical protein
MDEGERKCVAFLGDEMVAQGDICTVALKLKVLLDVQNPPAYLVFDEDSGRQIDLDLHGNHTDISVRLRPQAGDRDLLERSSDELVEPQAPQRKGVGRPKLGVVAREVTLLPRHWDWLNEQPGGASVALRKLVEEAKRTHVDRDRVRRFQEAAYRFMSAKAGNLEGFEEATRALFRADNALFLQITEPWPADVRLFSRRLAGITEDTAR